MAAEKLLLSVSDVCAILKACGEAKASELKFGGLHVKFGQPAPLPPPPAALVDTAPAPRTAEEMAALQKTQTQVSELARIKDEIALREEQLAYMSVVDPLAMERMLDEGDLIDEPADDADEE